MDRLFVSLHAKLRRPLLLVGVLGTAVSIVLFGGMRRIDRESKRDVYQRAARDRISAIQREARGVYTSLASLSEAAKNLSANEFREAACPFALANSIEWVGYAEDGGPPKLTNCSGNETAAAPGGVWREALEAARNGGIATTAPFQARTGGRTASVSLAVQRSGHGWVAVAIDHAALLERSLQVFQGYGVHVGIVDRTPGRAEVPLAFHKSRRKAGSAPEPLTSAAIRDSRDAVVGEIALPGGAMWLVYGLPVPEVLAPLSLTGMGALVGGLASTTLLILFIRSARERTRQIEKLVEERTHELAETRDKALEAVRAKSRFLATMSHEIRTPMNGVIGLAELLAATPLDQSQQDLLTNLRGSAQSLLEIVNDILDLSKIEAGKFTMAEERFALADSLDRAVQLFAVMARQKGVDLSYHLPDEVCLAARGDAGRLGQVLSNLIGNAVKFTDSGWVWVETELLQSTPHEAYLRFSVHDTGVGIEPETRARLFQPFFQADATSARKFGGTGLGLAISRQLVKMMGGEIGVESEPGRGSKFWFTIRLSDPLPDTEARRAPTGAESFRVALIGESGAICAADRYLEIWGIAVHRFADCAAAAAFFHDRLASRDRVESIDPRERWIAIVDVTREPVIATRAYLQDLDLFNVRLACISPSGMPYKLETPMRFAPLWLPAPIRRSRVFETIERIANPGGANATAIEESLETQSANLLLVEDNPVNQKVALGLLRRLGYEADAVSSGVEALEAARGGSYSAILMDCQMPGMDGFEATAAIRRLDGPISRAPIIALTANAMPGDRERCLEAGMDDYIPKPVQIDRLSEVLERWTRVAA